MARGLNALIGLLTALYPAAVYFGLQYLQPRLIALILAALLLLRLALLRTDWSKPLLLAGVAYAGFAVWSNQAIALRFYPALVNAAMLTIFAASLFYPPTIVERLARLQQPDLPEQGVLYTRRVTQVWCGFFVVNGAIATVTALWSSFQVWSLYNGLIAYLLMGLLFVGEYWLRQRVMKPE